MSDAARKVTEPRMPQEKFSGGHLVAKALGNEGVDAIFTPSGGHIIDIDDGCLDEGIEIVDVRQEQVAAPAADGYARQTGNPGCAVVMSGKSAVVDIWVDADEYAPGTKAQTMYK